MVKIKNNLPEFKISLRKKGCYEDMYLIDNPDFAAELCRSLYNRGTLDYKEEFYAIALNRANKVLGYHQVSSGGVSGTVCDPKVIFQFALLCNASRLILTHNHPSGNRQPSPQDKEITNKIRKGAEAFDIQVLDHIIITSEGFFSFSEGGLI